MIDSKLGLNEWNRKKIWKMADKCFDEIIKMKLHGLNNIMSSYQKFVKSFPQPPENTDNTWFCQALFRNSNIKTKIQQEWFLQCQTPTPPMRLKG